MKKPDHETMRVELNNAGNKTINFPKFKKGFFHLSFLRRKFVRAIYINSF